MLMFHGNVINVKNSANTPLYLGYTVVLGVSSAPGLDIGHKAIKYGTSSPIPGLHSV